MKYLVWALWASAAWAKQPAPKTVSLEELCLRSKLIVVGKVDREAKSTITKSSADGMTTVDVEVDHYKISVSRTLKQPPNTQISKMIDAIDESALGGHSMSKALLLAGAAPTVRERYKSGYAIHRVAKRTGEYIFFFSEVRSLSDPKIKAWASSIDHATEVLESESKIKSVLAKTKVQK